MTYRVLIVDDDPDVREVLNGLLTMKGHEVLTAADGMAAVSQATKYCPDLMILDVMMPRMSGFQTCQAIRRLQGFSKIPVVFLSAKKTEKDREHGKQIGGDIYLTKPFNEKHLLYVVKQLLRERAHPETEERIELDPPDEES